MSLSIFAQTQLITPNSLNVELCYSRYSPELNEVAVFFHYIELNRNDLWELLHNFQELSFCTLSVNIEKILSILSFMWNDIQRETGRERKIAFYHQLSFIPRIPPLVLKVLLSLYIYFYSKDQSISVSIQLTKIITTIIYYFIITYYNFNYFTFYWAWRSHSRMG